MARNSVLLAPIVALMLAGAMPSEVWGHARIKSASPPPDATVASGLTQIRLVFNEALEPSFSFIELSDHAGAVIETSEGRVICESDTCTLSVEPLAEGDYAVRYHVLSADGHVVEGGHTFRVAD